MTAKVLLAPKLPASRGWLGDHVQGLTAAFRFLTCLPLPGSHVHASEGLDRALLYFPLVGLAIGALLVGLDFALASIVARPLRDFVLLVTVVISSGGLHLDGLIDTADGLFAAGPPERRLDAMRQSSARPRGAAAALAILVVEYAAFSAMPLANRVPALLLAPMLGRWAIVYGYVAYPYARKVAGLSLALKKGASRAVVVAATAWVVLMIGLLLWPTGFVLLLLAWLIAAAAGRLAVRRLGGMSGDVYGAVEQIVETTGLLVAPVLSTSSWRL